MLEVSPTKQVGLGLTAFGLLFMALGVMLFFDGALLTLGNILLVVGSLCVFGFRRSTYFYWTRGRRRASVVILLGLIVSLAGWALAGLVFELIGYLILLRASLPSLASLPLFAATILTSPDSSEYPLFDSAPKKPTTTGCKDESSLFSWSLADRLPGSDGARIRTRARIGTRA